MLQMYFPNLENLIKIINNKNNCFFAEFFLICGNSRTAGAVAYKIGTPRAGTFKKGGGSLQHWILGA